MVNNYEKLSRGAVLDLVKKILMDLLEVLATLFSGTRQISLVSHQTEIILPVAAVEIDAVVIVALLTFAPNLLQSSV